MKTYNEWKQSLLERKIKILEELVKDPPGSTNRSALTGELYYLQMDLDSRKGDGDGMHETRQELPTKPV